MLKHLILLTAAGVCFAVPAKAEQQIYNPYALGVTYHQLQREQARQERAAVFGQDATRYPHRRRSRHITAEEERQVLAIDKQMKQRFPIHPGLYRDAYDRGTFKRKTTGGNNPGD